MFFIADANKVLNVRGGSIAYNINSNNDGGSTGSSNDEPFTSATNRLYAVPKYTEFGDVEAPCGIPFLANAFKNIDPLNDLITTTATDYHHRFCAETSHRTHLYQYLTSNDFQKNVLLKSRKYDHVVYAIYAYMLYWSDSDLKTFARCHLEFNLLIVDLINERAARPVYCIVIGDDDNTVVVPFLKSTFQLLTRFFNPPSPTTAECSFDIYKYVKRDHIVQWKNILNKLKMEILNDTDIVSIEKETDSLFETILREYSWENRKSVKVLTGQACCGKTTLLRVLEADGWTNCSRGEIGSFAGKARSPYCVAALHMALEHAQRQPGVIGDRGAIDNPLWVAIQPLLDPKYADCIVENLVLFFNLFLNEHVISYLSMQDVVVFIDPIPSCNRKRMMKRCEGSDAIRSRIHSYPIVQFMAYYISAKLFGWKIVCVPYDEAKKNICPKKYQKIINDIKIRFGQPPVRRDDDDVAVKKIIASLPKPDCFPLSNEYPIDLGVFK